MRATPLLALCVLLGTVACGGESSPDASAANDAATDGVVVAPSDTPSATLDGGSPGLDSGGDAAPSTGDGSAAPADASPPPDGGASALPRTFQDDYLPELRIDLTPANLAALLVEGSTARVPMTLRYMGMTYAGTVRQRLGNHSRCGTLRQFRLDLSSTVRLPDGYRTDRFETDRGLCWTLHEWFSSGVLRRVATRRPEAHVLYKYANVAAIFFNDELYNVETLTEDVNTDLVERFEGTRMVQLYENGCYQAAEAPWLQTFCRTFDRPALERMLDVSSFLAWTAVVKALVPGDSYPDFPYNFYLVHNMVTGLARPLGDDWDETPALEPDVMADPFTVAHPEGDFQRHFTALLMHADLRERYRAALRDARDAMDPAVTLPLLSAKYAQVRPLLARVRGGAVTMDQYDDMYMRALPQFIRDRHAHLGRLLAP